MELMYKVMCMLFSFVSTLPGYPLSGKTIMVAATFTLLVSNCKGTMVMLRYVHVTESPDDNPLAMGKSLASKLQTSGHITSHMLSVEELSEICWLAFSVSRFVALFWDARQKNEKLNVAESVSDLMEENGRRYHWNFLEIVKLKKSDMRVLAAENIIARTTCCLPSTRSQHLLEAMS